MVSCFELGTNTGPFSEQRLVMESPLPAANYILVWREARERHVGVTYLAKVQAKYVQAKIQRAQRTEPWATAYKLHSPSCFY